MSEPSTSTHGIATPLLGFGWVYTHRRLGTTRSAGHSLAPWARMRRVCVR